VVDRHERSLHGFDVEFTVVSRTATDPTCDLLCCDDTFTAFDELAQRDIQNQSSRNLGQFGLVSIRPRPGFVVGDQTSGSLGQTQVRVYQL
jgi:hypothetical protein